MDMELEKPRRKRRRPPKACEQCRRRKVRCDQESPCNQCTRLKIESCTYDLQATIDRDAKRRKQTVVSQQGVAALTPVSNGDHESISRLRDYPGPSNSVSAATTPSAVRSGPLTDPVQPQLDSADILEEDVLHVKVLNCTNRMPGPTHSGLHGTVTKTRLVGRSHWMNVVEQFSWVMKLQVQLAHGDGTGEIINLLGKCKSLGRAIKSQMYSELRSLPHIKDYIPSRDVADRLVENYFRVFESCYRVLHVPTFRKEYVQFWTNPGSVGQTFLVKLILVLAIGTSITDEQEYVRLHGSALEWVNAAHAWLTSPFTEKTRLSVSAIQTHCLLLIAREVISIGPDLIWISAGSLLRAAMLTGLHRDPSQFPRLNECQSEIRRRLWATVMELCLQAAMNAGGSPMISSDMHDCRPPANLDDEDLDHETGFVASPKDENVLTQTSIQIALLQTFGLRCKVARMLNDFRVEPSWTDTLRISSQLSDAYKRISHRLKPQHSGPTAPFLTYDMMTTRFILGLHQNFAVKALTDPTFYYSRKVCLDKSLHVFSAICSADSRADADFANFLDSASGTPKNVTLLSLMLVAMELVSQLEDENSEFHNAPEPTITENLVRREMFRIFEAHCNLTLNRIRRGETNVKGYVFGQCGIAHMRALANNEINRDEKAFLAGKQALELVRGILEQKLEEASIPKTSDQKPADDADMGPDDLGIPGIPGMPFGDDFGWDDWDFEGALGAGEFFMPQL